MSGNNNNGTIFFFLLKKRLSTKKSKRVIHRTVISWRRRPLRDGCDYYNRENVRVLVPHIFENISAERFIRNFTGTSSSCQSNNGGI